MRNVAKIVKEEETSTSFSKVSAEQHLKRISTHLQSVLKGQQQLIELAMTAFLAQGHLLLEGTPGIGKTSLAKAMATSFGGTFHRVQMTSDLLPSDIVGILRIKPGNVDFEFRKGPLFSNFLLADELNRTSPKTQSALLEAMAEKTATVDGISHSLPDPFFVIATQNPMEFQGVYPLAESQLDRFMLKLHFEAPDKKDELQIYKNSEKNSEKVSTSLLTIEQSRSLCGFADKIHVEESIAEYVTDLVRATRVHPSVIHGVSVRGGLQLLAAARALAFLRGYNFVKPNEIIDLAVPTLAHRISCSESDAVVDKSKEVIQEILNRVKPPK
jgi:MoxR-like ATPase